MKMLIQILARKQNLQYTNISNKAADMYEVISLEFLISSVSWHFDTTTSKCHYESQYKLFEPQTGNTLFSQQRSRWIVYLVSIFSDGSSCGRDDQRQISNNILSVCVPKELV